MEHMIGLLNIQWKDKHVIVNEDQPDYTVGVFKKMEWVIDSQVYELPMRVKITFGEDSDVPERIFEASTLSIKKDKRYED